MVEKDGARLLGHSWSKHGAFNTWVEVVPNSSSAALIERYFLLKDKVMIASDT